jgi:hypothetical protein
MLRNLYARLWLRAPYFLETYAPWLDTAIGECLDSGITGYEQNDYWALVSFKNGVTYIYWNVNRYYSWLHRGFFTTGNRVFQEYANYRPSAWTMYRLKRAVDAFNHEKNIMNWKSWSIRHEKKPEIFSCN